MTAFISSYGLDHFLLSRVDGMMDKATNRFRKVRLKTIGVRRAKSPLCPVSFRQV